MTPEYVRERITQLRLQKGVSEYRMSYDLGHSRGYVNNITSGKALPSMTEFFAICEYFEVSITEFFDADLSDPKLYKQSVVNLDKLDEDDLKLLGLIINRMLDPKDKKI